MSHRFFKTTREVYDAARSGLDVIFGHPNGKADTCLPPEPLTTQDGVVLAVMDEMTQWTEVAPLIADLIASGAATEITREEYEAAQPSEGQIE